MVGDSTAKVVNSEQITTATSTKQLTAGLVILPQRQLILSKSQQWVRTHFNADVGDSTAKVVNSEQITTCFVVVGCVPQLVILPQRQLILSKSQPFRHTFSYWRVGDSTAKVVNSEQITTVAGCDAIEVRW